MFVECVNICLSESLSVADSVQQVMFFYIQSYLTHWTEHNAKTLASSCRHFVFNDSACATCCLEGSGKTPHRASPSSK